MERVRIDEIFHKYIVVDFSVLDSINVLIYGFKPQLIQAFVTDVGHTLLIAAEWMYHPYHFEMYQS